MNSGWLPRPPAVGQELLALNDPCKLLEHMLTCHGPKVTFQLLASVAFGCKHPLLLAPLYPSQVLSELDSQVKQALDSAAMLVNGWNMQTRAD